MDGEGQGSHRATETPAEFITLLTKLDQETPVEVKRIFLRLDNASIHQGKQVQAWFATHPRFICHFLPVHCSWMNQIEQWFSSLQRKRLRINDFSDLDHLAQRIMGFALECASTPVQRVEQVRSQGYGESRYSNTLVAAA